MEFKRQNQGQKNLVDRGFLGLVFRGRIFRGGFTLIELMAVIIILSLTAALGAVRLSAVSDQTALKSASARWSDLDAKARLHARSRTPVILVLSNHDSTLTIQNSRTHEILASANWPDSITVSLSIESSDHTIPISPTGTSPDYTVRFSTADHSQRLQCFGLTGYLTREEE